MDSLSSARELVYNVIGHDNRFQRRVGKRRGERWKKEKSLVKGVFLGAGSINNPDNKYHLEIRFSNQKMRK